MELQWIGHDWVTNSHSRPWEMYCLGHISSLQVSHQFFCYRKTWEQAFWVTEQSAQLALWFLCTKLVFAVSLTFTWTFANFLSFSKDRTVLFFSQCLFNREELLKPKDHASRVECFLGSKFLMFVMAWNGRISNMYLEIVYSILFCCLIFWSYFTNFTSLNSTTWTSEGHYYYFLWFFFFPPLLDRFLPVCWKHSFS